MEAEPQRHRPCNDGKRTPLLFEMAKGHGTQDDIYRRTYGRPIDTDGKRCFTELREMGVARQFSWGFASTAIIKHDLKALEVWDQFGPMDRQVMRAYVRRGRIRIPLGELLSDAGLDPDNRNHRRVVQRLTARGILENHGRREGRRSRRVQSGNQGRHAVLWLRRDLFGRRANRLRA